MFKYFKDMKAEILIVFVLLSIISGIFYGLFYVFYLIQEMAK